MYLKIHANHLSPVSRKKLLGQIAAVQKWKFTYHALENVQKRGISLEELSQAVAKGDIIEYHTKRGTNRVLLKYEDGTCVVVDLDLETIITAYKNTTSDNLFGVIPEKYLFGV